VGFYNTCYVTFGDGAEGNVLGIGNIINNELPKLDNVLLVKGLTFNLISISQLCDQGMHVNFSKSECVVTNEKGEILTRGIKSKENCYLWVPQEKGQTREQTRRLHIRPSTMVFSFNTIQHPLFQFPTLHIIFSLLFNTHSTFTLSNGFSFNTLSHHFLFLLFLFNFIFLFL